MDNDFPDRRGQVYTENITLRVEPELKSEFEWLKENTTKDIGECQRMALRELAKKLKQHSQSA